MSGDARNAPSTDIADYDAPVVAMEEGQQRDAQDVDKLRAQAKDVKLREQGLTQVKQAVGEMHTIMQDMAIIVDQNNDLLNLTEVNIEETQDRVEKTNVELVRAQNYQKWYKRTRNRVILILIVLAIFIAVIIFIAIR